MQRAASLVRLQHEAFSFTNRSNLNVLCMQGVLGGGVRQNKLNFDAFTFVGHTMLQLLLTVVFYVDRLFNHAKTSVALDNGLNVFLLYYGIVSWTRTQIL